MLQIGVFRIFGNELDQPVDDYDVALQLHKNRSKALHEVFDNQPDLMVSDWGQTDDSSAHEFVSIAISMGATVLTKYVVIPAVKYIFQKIADKAIDTAMEKSVSWIISKLRKQQDDKKIGEFHIRLPNGIVLTANNPKQGSKITFYVNGVTHEISF